MAPEMLGGEAPRICAQTDVYLLGAVLHEILTGQPPHQGAELRDMLKSIITGVGELPESVPEALRNICRRALANDPDARFETPLQLKLALEGYLRHRGSQRLGERALERLDELLVCIERAEKLTPEERRQRGEEVLQEIHGLISECRFGFREALAQWPENRAAQAGLRRALEVMTAHEARIGDAKAARAYLAQLEDPDPALVALVERAEAERAQQAARLVELEKHHDIRTGMRTRTFMAALMGLLWTGLPIAGGEWLAARYEWAAVSYTTLSAVTYACIALLLGLGYWARESMMSTPMNRRFFGAIVALLVLQRGFVAVCEAHALPMDQAFTLLFAFWTSLAVLQAISMHLGLFVTALGYGLATLLSVYYPGSNLRILAAANFVFTANLIWLGMPVLREDHRDRLARTAQAEGAKRPEA
jgi:serine/threonine-protein kinase